MPLYNPPLLLKSTNDINSRFQIDDALKGLEYSYFYTGKRLGQSNIIDLEVSTLIMDADENQFLRSCLYSGQKDTWKNVIKEQIKQHLIDIGVEEGFVRGETRYFNVSKDYHLPPEKYLSKLLDVIAKIRGNENNHL